MSDRNGPTLAIVGDCAGCEHLRTDVTDARLGRTRHAACVHPTRNDGGIILWRSRGPYPMPTDCPCLSAARLALLVDLARTVCRRCGAIVEPERECYAIPTCFACLPPPPRMPVHTFGEIDESAIRTMVVGDTLSEPTSTPGEHVKVELSDGGWLVRLSDGDMSLAGTSKLAMVYVKERRERAHSREEPAS